MKRCTKCNEIKGLSEFYKDKSCRDGRYVWCKECAKEYHRNRRIRIAERVEKANKRSNDRVDSKASNPVDLVRERKKKYYKEYQEKNRKEINAKKKEAREKYKQYVKSLEQTVLDYENRETSKSFRDKIKVSLNVNLELEVSLTDNTCDILAHDSTATVDFMDDRNQPKHQ